MSQQERPLTDTRPTFNPTPGRPFYACQVCGCPDPELEVWQHANTDEVTGPSGEDWWCPACEDSDAAVQLSELHGDGIVTFKDYAGRVERIPRFTDYEADRRACEDCGCRWEVVELTTGPLGKAEGRGDCPGCGGRTGEPNES